MLRYFRGAFIGTILAFTALYYYTGNVSVLASAMVLSIMEVALSLDNSIVNATILKNMSRAWQTIFLSIGIIVAVGFMRFYLPIQMVSFLGHMSFMDSLHTAFNDPAKFSEIIVKSKDIVAGFGGAFLMMVSLEYFINIEKENHWVPVIELILAKFAQFADIKIFLVGVTAFVFSTFLGDHQLEFFGAALIGIAANIAVNVVKETLAMAEKVFAIASGLGMFIYLEILDASFSFDGVIAAFAITNSIVTIAVGLGVGALYVRSMTVALSQSGTLAEYRFLEAGAFWAIAGLSIFMFLGTVVEIPDFVIASYSSLVIITAFVHSWIRNVADEVMVTQQISDDFHYEEMIWDEVFDKVFEEDKIPEVKVIENVG